MQEDCPRQRLVHFWSVGHRRQQRLQCIWTSSLESSTIC